MQKLFTDRLILRQYEMSDLDDFYNTSKSPKVGPMAGWKPHESIDESKTLLEKFSQTPNLWAVVLKETGKVIGSVGLHPEKIRQVPLAQMMGCVLSEEYWGEGIMPEACKEVLKYAFESMYAPIVTACHFGFNAQSKRVIEKLGFTYEGTLRLAFVGLDGALDDEVWYSMTNAEYREKYSR